MQVAINLGREMLSVSLLLAAPVLGAGLAVGVIVAILQTITSLQEQTLSLVPKMLVVAGVVFFLLPWMLRVLASFTQPLLQNLGRFAV
ncbi:MAG: flagellar biosynthetic protein FliQ [Planctomycetota bacterium]